MSRLQARLRHDEGGAALIVVLGFLAFIGLMSVALLNYSSTNLKATVKLRELRGNLSAADAFAEMAIAAVRQDRSLAPTAGGVCFTGTNVNVNEEFGADSLQVRCSGTTSGGATDAVLTVCVVPCDNLAVQTRLVAGVRYANPDPTSPTTITAWSVRK